MFTMLRSLFTRMFAWSWLPATSCHFLPKVLEIFCRLEINGNVVSIECVSINENVTAVVQSVAGAVYLLGLIASRYV
jgi:hypothetical protein